MGFEGTKFRLTTKIGKRKPLISKFNRPSSVDRFINEARRTKKLYPHSERTTIKLDVMRGKKVTGTKTFVIK